MKKVVLNKCYGGFGLSLLAQKEYLKLKGKKAYFYKQTKYSFKDKQEEFEKIKDIENSDDLFIHCLTVNLGDVAKKLKYRDKEYFSDHNIKRTDKDLIKIIEKLGEKANSRYSKLVIVEIPNNIKWEIDDYDGVETLREEHRSW